jgi:hypothetical protein
MVVQNNNGKRKSKNAGVLRCAQNDRHWRVRCASVDGPEGPVPAGSSEEVGELVQGDADLLSEACAVNLVFGGFEGPVDDEWAADDIGAGDEAPVAAVEAVGAVVAHDEEAVGRDDEVKAVDVGG